MAGHIKRLKPFENSHSRPVLDAFQLTFEFPEPRSNFLEQRFRLMAAKCSFTNPQDIAPDISQILSIQTKHFRPPRKTRQCPGKVVRRSRADLAQILRDDQIRRQLRERIGIHGIETLPSRNIFAHKPVDLCRRSILRQPRVNHYWFRSRARRIVTLVADSHDLLIQTEGKQDLRGRWQQGDNSHGPTLPQDARFCRSSGYPCGATASHNPTQYERTLKT